MIKLFLTHLGQYKKPAISAPVMVLLETIVGLILPTIMSNIVDVGVANADTDYMLRCGAIMLGLSLLGAAAGIASSRFSTLAANGFGSNLRVAMYEHIQEFSFADVDRFSTASLITRTTSDVRTLQMSFQMGLRVLLQAPFQLVVALIIVMGYSVRLSLVYLIAVPILFAVVFTLMLLSHKLFIIAHEMIDHLNADVQESLIAIRVVKSFVRYAFENKKFKTANDNLTRANIKALSLSILMNPCSTIILNLVTLLIYWIGGHMVGMGELLSGELLAVITYLNQIMQSIMMFSMVLMQMTRARASSTRIIEVLEAEPDIEDAPGAPEHMETRRRGAVEFRNVSFKYSLTGSGEAVLRDISFTAEPGQTVAVIGGTGSGKSSLVNLIPRFYDATEGQVLVDGVDVREYAIADLRSRIGMVLQKNVLFTGTIRDNMRWGKEDATDEEIWEALKNAQAADFVQAMPQGLDTLILQGGTNVSGGQKQRLCIARAMLKSPEILILDDSTSAVDSDTESRIRASFDRELKHCTVFIIAQRISSVVSADKIVVLDEGGVESVGTHAELMERSPIYREIYSSQQEGVLASA